MAGEQFARGTLVREMNVKFRAQVYAGDELRIVLTVKAIDRRGMVSLSVEVENQDEQKVASGTCSILPPRLFTEGGNVVGIGKSTPTSV